MKILVTGAAGFIGMHLAERLLKMGMEVVGIDNLNDYYAVSLKQDRLKQLAPFDNFQFIEMDLADRSGMDALFAKEGFDKVVNLAAQAGVRYSLENPHAYVNSNVVGFLNVLEGCRNNRVQHLVYASSSSVYGSNSNTPFCEHDNVDHPVSLYAATKKSNELMAHTYSHLYNLPTTGLRFFTVYGPWGRPDMAPSLFASAILENRPIRVFNEGRMQRDFTYIDDIVEGILRILDKPAMPDPSFDRSHPNPACSDAPFRVYNIGNHDTVELMTFIRTMEKAIGREAIKEMLPMQAGDVQSTWADIDSLQKLTGFKPDTPLDEGIEKFILWFVPYHKKSICPEGWQ